MQYEELYDLVAFFIRATTEIGQQVFDESAPGADRVEFIQQLNHVNRDISAIKDEIAKIKRTQWIMLIIRLAWAALWGAIGGSVLRLLLQGVRRIWRRIRGITDFLQIVAVPKGYSDRNSEEIDRAKVGYGRAERFTPDQQEKANRRRDQLQMQFDSETRGTEQSWNVYVVTGRSS